MASSASGVRVLRGMIVGGRLSVTSWRAVSKAMIRLPRLWDSHSARIQV